LWKLRAEEIDTGKLAGRNATVGRELAGDERKLARQER